MTDRSRWDPEMAAFTAAAKTEAAKYPPIRLEVPLTPHRATNDALNLPYAKGGPAMAETADRWIAARGRRIFCRLYSRAMTTARQRNGFAGWRQDRSCMAVIARSAPREGCPFPP